jgi:hypothetical protein
MLSKTLCKNPGARLLSSDSILKENHRAVSRARVPVESEDVFEDELKISSKSLKKSLVALPCLHFKTSKNIYKMYVFLKSCFMYSFSISSAS